MEDFMIYHMIKEQILTRYSNEDFKKNEAAITHK